MTYFPLSKIDLRKKFENRKWLNTKSSCEYAYDKTILANKASVNNSDLVDYLIERISDETLRDQAKMQRFEIKGGLLKAFEKIKMSKKTTIIAKNEEFNKVNSANKEKCKSGSDWKTNENEDQSFNKFGDNKEIQSYNCSRFGHFSTNCKKEKRQKDSCFICSSTDHKIRDCPEYKKESGNKIVINIEQKVSDSESHPQLSLHFELDGEQFEIRAIALLDSRSPISFIKSKLLNLNMIEPYNDTEFIA